jgi:hypothetical protein
MNNNIPDTQIEDNSDALSQSKILIKEKSITGKGILYDMSLLIGIILLILHIFLCYKLYSIDQAILIPSTICLNKCTKGSLNFF